MINVIDEIKSRIDIVSFISEYLPLKPAGTSFKALCPFHQEKAPSFFVSPERQIWHCFGCGAGGSIFDFLMKMEGLEFPEALRLLAKKANVVLKKEDPQLVSQRTRLLEIFQQAARFYHEILTRFPLGESARRYLKERRVSPEIIKEFQLGYAPDSWQTLLIFLTKKGFKEKEIALAGLAIQSERSKDRYYDRFRDRLIFPLFDVHGEIVGFSGRILEKDEKKVKYINTPQTLIYDKSRILYGLDKAKQEIKEKKLAIITEGQMDVLASYQIGIKNVVASSGTALTLEQIKLLKRFTSNLALAFDLDPAGQEALRRGIEIAWREGMEIKVIRIKEAKDPDELIKKNPQLWKEAIEKAESIMEYYFRNVLEGRDLSKVEEKKAAAKVLLPLIARLKDKNKIEQTHWLQQLGLKLGIEEKILREEMNRLESKEYGFKEERGVVVIKKPRDLMLGERLMGLLLKFSQDLRGIVENLDPKILASQRLQDFVRILKTCFDNPEIVKKEIIKNNPNLKEYFDFLLFAVEKDLGEGVDLERIKKEVLKIWLELKKNQILKELKKAERELKFAEQEGKVNQIRSWGRIFKQLTKELAKLDNSGFR